MVDQRIDPQGIRPGYALSKLGQSGASNGQIPVWNNTTKQWEPATPSSGSGIVVSVVAGSNVSVDSTDPAHPIVAASFTETLPASIIDAKGDLIVGLSNDTPARKAVGSNGQVLTADSTATGGVKWAAAAATKEALFKANATLTAATGTTRLYNDYGSTLTIVSIRITVETAPSGGSVVCDVNKNGTTIFTTQANRPTITTGNLTSGKVTNMDITSFADGDYLTIDVDTATTPAANLTVTVVLA